MAYMLFFAVIWILALRWGVRAFVRADDAAQWAREREQRHAVCNEGVRQYRLAQLNKREI